MYATGSPATRRSMAARYICAASAPTGASLWATIAVLPTPTALASKSSASSRGVSDPASRSRSAPSRSRSPVRGAVGPETDGSAGPVTVAESLGLVGHDQGIDQVVEVAVHDRGQVVEGLADAMVGDAVLREV